MSFDEQLERARPTERIIMLAHDDPPAAEALARQWATDAARLRYGAETTSPASPGGPDPEEDPAP